jgi:hypothetical protein
MSAMMTRKKMRGGEKKKPTLLTNNITSRQLIEIKMMTSRLHYWILFLSCWSFCLLDTANAFATVSPRGLTIARGRDSVKCSLVNEEDVLEAVEHTEALWVQALEARKAANAVSDRAEDEAEAAAESAKEADMQLRNRTQPISLEQLAQADAAAKSNMDAGSLVGKALDASDEADRLERLAEEALQKSEEILEQHLVDYPDSSLAE